MIQQNQRAHRGCARQTSPHPCFHRTQFLTGAPKSHVWKWLLPAELSRSAPNGRATATTAVFWRNKLCILRSFSVHGAGDEAAAVGPACAEDGEGGQRAGRQQHTHGRRPCAPVRGTGISRRLGHPVA